MDFVSLPVASLNKLLRKVYVEARRKDKQPYTKSSLTAIRFGLDAVVSKIADQRWT